MTSQSRNFGITLLITPLHRAPHDPQTFCIVGKGSRSGLGMFGDCTYLKVCPIVPQNMEEQLHKVILENIMQANKVPQTRLSITLWQHQKYFPPLSKASATYWAEFMLFLRKPFWSCNGSSRRVVCDGNHPPVSGSWEESSSPVQVGRTAKTIRPHLTAEEQQ